MPSALRFEPVAMVVGGRSEPVDDDWEGVEAIEEISEQYEKKHYRMEPHRSLYRDFNTAFRNATGFRTRTVEA